LHLIDDKTKNKNIKRQFRYRRNNGRI